MAGARREIDAGSRLGRLSPPMTCVIIFRESTSTPQPHSLPRASGQATSQWSALLLFSHHPVCGAPKGNHVPLQFACISYLVLSAAAVLTVVQITGDIFDPGDPFSSTIV